MIIRFYKNKERQPDLNINGNTWKGMFNYRNEKVQRRCQDKIHALVGGFDTANGINTIGANPDKGYIWAGGTYDEIYISNVFEKD